MLTHKVRKIGGGFPSGNRSHDSQYHQKIPNYLILRPGKDPTQAESFRPIALLSILGKVAEKIILKRLYHHVDTNNILIPEQHGFGPDLSTTHQLLRVVETIKSGLKDKKSTGAVFLDIQKAFDRVWREGLIFKLIKYDFPSPLIKLISSYLADRNFSVRINDTHSSHRPTEAGVAQGTLISPLIYVNDIPTHHNTTLCMFADDTAILASHTEPKLVARAINRHLLVLEDWFSKWKIALNVAKTEAVFFTRKKRLIYPDIFLHNEKIPWSQNTKYLGVTLDNKLTFKQHITRIRENFIKKAHTLSHLISRRSKLSRSNKLLIYSSLLRPIITYASPVWSFAAKTHIQKLEVLQNKTLRQILRADWYMRNASLRNAINFKTIRNFMKKIAKKFFIKIDQSDNISIQRIEKYTPTRLTHRPRNILII
ncbi:RNA-directed DNA polymerase from mobile element jockey [Trichonephila clavipes]|uniref:RNA-directed DNA polymerase from mobile element jockey n=1 Tax=Trichonephila clavipes TaxID=2585209 RepID=A0A8X6V3X3_TRICX|nr:RNA-directed DNA polymerase from mobile element jockey [Trichonephila clavipes]